MTTVQNTSRAGERWTSKEDQQLLRETAEGMAPEDIAEKHQRTMLAITMRQTFLGCAANPVDEIKKDVKLLYWMVIAMCIAQIIQIVLVHYT